MPGALRRQDLPRLPARVLQAPAGVPFVLGVGVRGVAVDQSEAGVGAAQPVRDVLRGRRAEPGVIVPGEHGGPAPQARIGGQLQQRFGAAADHGGVGDRLQADLSWPPGVAGGLIDLDGLHPREDALDLQRCAAGDPAAGEYRVESGDPPVAGGFQGALHSDRRDVSDLVRVEVVAHDDEVEAGA